MTSPLLASQRSPARPRPPRDIPQPSSLLVAGKELGADSIKDAQIAPAQATPQPPVPRQHQG
eukprot:scaffold82663_cov49-Phaeocystis_antarctica.AAC.3